MPFYISTRLFDCTSLEEFFTIWNVGNSDLIITNENLLASQLGGRKAPCDFFYRQQFGSGEPTDEMVDKMLRVIDGKFYERIIAIGGGSIIDMAKLLVFGDGLNCEKIFAEGATLPRKRKLIVIPTTCGTGSEVTMISVMHFKQKGMKMGLAVPALFPDEAVLIPNLLRTLTYEVFASSSIDALIHSVESFVSPKATPYSRAMSRDSIERIVRGYKALVKGGDKKLPCDEELYSFLTASVMAGISFSNAGTGAVHALSYPIGGIYHVPHGKANYMMFKAVFAAYKKLGADFSNLEEVLSGALECDPEQVWEKLFGLIDNIQPRQPLSELGIDETKCKEMAASVIKNQQRLLVNNPIPLDEQQLMQIYIDCL